MARRHRQRRPQTPPAPAHAHAPVPAPAPAPSSAFPLPSVHSIAGLVPEGFTYQSYIDSCPLVNGRFMAMFSRHGGDKRIVLPCKVLRIDEENKKAVVRAADGADITIVDIKVTIRNSCIEVLGKPIAPDVLTADEISSLPDDEDFDSANLRIEYLLHPRAWGAAPGPSSGYPNE